MAKTSSHPKPPTPIFLTAESAPSALESLSEGSSAWHQALESLVNEKARRVVADRPSILGFESTEPMGAENFLCAFIGEKHEGRHSTGQRALKVIVRKKNDAVEEGAFIPEVFEHNNQLFPTDVEEGDIFLLQGSIPPMHWSPTPPPFKGGFSISLKDDNSAGTFGALVMLKDGQVCLLSNNHVIGRANKAKTGADGDEVVALADLDGDILGLKPISIGRVTKIHPIEFNTGAVNTVDAAVALVNRDLVSPDFLGWGANGKLNPEPITAPKEGMVVKKVGRTTAFTAGIITSTFGIVPQLPYGSGQKADFRQQLVIEGINGPFSDRGDSGSLVVEAASNRPVALLFAGATTRDGRSYTFANPIIDVISKLGIFSFLNQMPSSA